MKINLDILVIKNKNPVPRDFSLTRESGDTFVCAGTMQSPIGLEDVPTEFRSDAVCFLNENSLVPKDYISRIVSSFNLNRNSSIIYGPIGRCIPVKKNIPFVEDYKNWEANFSSNFLSGIVAPEFINSLYGCVFNSYYLNRMPYSPTTTPRISIETPYRLFNSLHEKAPIIYSKHLETLYFVSSEEQDNENIFNYFYELGVKSEILGTTNYFDEEQHKLIYDIAKLEYKTGRIC